jgi:hypothetical protein
MSHFSTIDVPRPLLTRFQIRAMLLPPAPPKTAIEQQVADKRATLQAIETEMVAALEWEATTRHAAGSVRMDCQSALNSFQVTASKSFHLVSPISSVSCAV